MHACICVGAGKFVTAAAWASGGVGVKKKVEIFSRNVKNSFNSAFKLLFYA